MITRKNSVLTEIFKYFCFDLFVLTLDFQSFQTFRLSAKVPSPLQLRSIGLREIKATKQAPSVVSQILLFFLKKSAFHSV